MTVAVVVVLVWLIPWVLANSIGKAKGRGGQGWVLGMFLGWVGVIIIALLPRLNHAAPAARPVKPRNEKLPSWWR